MIERAAVITGSFNFSEQAGANAENVLIISGTPALADAYEKNFYAHLRRSQKYEQLKPTTIPGTKPATPEN